MSRGRSPVSNTSASSAAYEQGTPMGATLHEMVRKGRSFSGHERNCCFLNLGGGKFADVSALSGFDFPDDGRAVARCDWDLDGDLDLWIANRSGPQVRFLRNDLETQHHFLSIRLEGKTCNRDAIGARVEVILQKGNTGSEKSIIIKTLRAGEGFLAQSSKWLHLGLGSATEIEHVIVRWPGGDFEEFDGLTVDHHYHLVQHRGRARLWTPPERKSLPKPTEMYEPKSTDQARVVSAAQMPLPPLDYQTFDGQPRWLEQVASGQPKLVNLWASWCRPCLQELREFAQREVELQQAGVVVIALSVDLLDVDKGTDSAATLGLSKAVPGLLKNVGYSGKAGWATPATVEKLQLVQNHLFDLHQPMSVPTSLLIDSAGQLAVLYRGPISVDQLLADVAQLPTLASSPTALPFTGRWHTRRNRLSPLDVAWQLVEHGYLEETIEYIARNKKLLENSYNISKLLVLVGNGQLARGEAESAISYYREALRIDVNYGEAQNNLAWVLSTHPDGNLRNGKEAIRLITTALKERSGNVSSLLDTLAAAYAEEKQFEQAVAVTKQAIEIAKASGQLERARKIESRLRLYQAQKPYRDK
ncbi:MAG: ASPIC/UnbV domain-containing protein [Pirellulales bacterium]